MDITLLISLLFCVGGFFVGIKTRRLHDQGKFLAGFAVLGGYAALLVAWQFFLRPYLISVGYLS